MHARQKVGRYFTVLLGACGAVGGLVCAPAPARAEVNFTACPTGSVARDSEVRCAVVAVPLDYRNPGGARISVTVSRIPAKGPSKGAMFANPGGPGSDALNYWVSRSRSLPEEFTHYDRLAVQPRGLRFSTPARCGRTNADPQAIHARCARENAPYLASLTTENTARDMDAVRAALGIEKVNFLGSSYGTYLGAVYATLFPQYVDTMILDSAVNPNWLWTEQMAQQQLAARDRTNDLFTWLAAHDPSYHLGNTPLRVYRSWVRLVTQEGGGWFANLTPPPSESADHPEPVTPLAGADLDPRATEQEKLSNIVRLLVTRGHTEHGPLLGATEIALYTRGYWPAFGAAMSRAHADPKQIAGLAALEGIRRPDPTNKTVFTAVTCNENSTPARRELAATALATLASGGPVTEARAAAVRSGTACQDWPAVTRPIPIDGTRLATPPVILHSLRDPITPYPGAPALTQALRGTLITVAGGDHGTLTRHNHPLNTLVQDYLHTKKATPHTLPEPPL